MKNNKLSRLIVMFVTALGWLGFIGAVTPVRGQDLVCCDIFIDADGNWFGARRDCKAALQELSPASRAKACAEIRKAPVRPWFRPFRDSASGLACCPEAAEVCGDASLNCTDASDRPDRPKLPKANCKDEVTPTISIFELPETLNIDESPEMPNITAIAKVSPPDADVTWTAQITYQTPGGCSGGPKFDSPQVTGSGEIFTPDFGGIYGGKLEIKAKTTCGRSAETTITRDIGGRNANPGDVRTEIGTMGSPFEADDLKKIACQESQQLQFKTDSTPLLGARGTRGDVGTMQICYMRTVGDVWNWKTNIASGRANLLEKVGFSRGVPRMVRRRSVRGQGPFPNAVDFTPEQLRLEAIKRYNAGNEHNVGYWEWDDAAGDWVANPQGGGHPDYVNGVLSRTANCSSP